MHSKNTVSLCAASLVGGAALSSVALADSAAYVLFPFGDQVLDVLVVDDSAAWVTGSGANLGIHEFALGSGTVTTLTIDPPLASPGRLLLPNGGPLSGDDVLISDWNSEIDSSCCLGFIGRYDADTDTFTPFYSGGDLAPAGDPFGLTWSPGGAWTDELYCSDFQGASPVPPMLFSIDASGGSSIFVQDESRFGLSDALNDVAFSPFPAFGPDLFVAFSDGDGDAQDGILVFDPAGDSTLFAALGNPRAMVFAETCAGERLVVATNSNQLYSVDAAGTTELLMSNLPNGDGVSFGGLDVLDDNSLIAAWGSNLLKIRLCGADFNDDCTVNVDDLLALLANWGDGPDENQIDLTGDGAINVDDLLKLLATWGDCD